MYKKELFKIQDKKYRDFVSKLTPNIDSETIIGIRFPELRKLSKQIFKDNNYQDFLDDLPHEYFEENNLHVLLVSQIKDYDKCILEINKFLPYINNWSTCDTFSPKVFTNNKDKLIKEIKKWIKSKDTYTIRFGVLMLMKHYLDEDFKEEYLKLVSKIKSDEYYVNMMIAWYFATALAKQYEYTLPYIKNKILSPWVHNKTIQKAIESYRISEDKKALLRTLKV